MSWLVLGFVVVTVVSGISFATYTILYPETTPVDRLERLTHAAARFEAAGRITTRDDAAVERIAARLGRLAQGDDQDQINELRDQLKHAGYRHRRAVEVFQGIRVAAFFGLAVLAAPATLFMGSTSAVVLMVVAAGIGYYVPLFALNLLATNRQSDLLNSYPDALDLLVISVESGLGLDAAFRRVATEMRTVSPTLAKEFSLVNTEISAGIERIVALRHLQERTGLDDVRSLVNMLQQAERYGSSIAQSLRLYSNIGREKRMARAEEKAGQVSSKLTIIMIIFLLPVLMAILLAPSFIRIVNDMDAQEEAEMENDFDPDGL